MKITTIQISMKTRYALKESGKKGETYDDVIQKLLKFYKEK